MAERRSWASWFHDHTDRRKEQDRPAMGFVVPRQPTDTKKDR